MIVVPSTTSGLLSPGFSVDSNVPFLVNIVSGNYPVAPIRTAAASFSLVPDFSTGTLRIPSTVSVPFTLRMLTLPLLRVATYTVPSYGFTFIAFGKTPFAELIMWATTTLTFFSLGVELGSFLILFFLVPRYAPLTMGPLTTRAPPLVVFVGLPRGSGPRILSIPGFGFVRSVTTPSTPFPELSWHTVDGVLSSLPRARVSVPSLGRDLLSRAGPFSRGSSLWFAVKPLCFSLCVTLVSSAIPFVYSLGEKVAASVPLWGSSAVNVGTKTFGEPRAFAVSNGYLYFYTVPCVHNTSGDLSLSST